MLSNSKDKDKKMEIKIPNETLIQKETPDETHVIKYIHPRSFFNLTTIIIKKIQLNAPFPNELNHEQLINEIAANYLEGFLVKDNEGVFCKSEEIVKRQSGIFSEMAKQIAKGLFKSGTVSISLPIRMFEPRSMLERYSDWWTFAPVLLKKAGACSDKIEAFKYVICFVLSALFLSTGQLKPFNPFLGETYEASFEDGTKVYLEHTGHLPCVTNYLITDPDGFYNFYGYCDISIEGAMKMLFNNTITMLQRGKNTVYLKTTEQIISYQLPKIILGGVIHGSRYVLLDGHIKFEDRANNLKAVILFNKNHPNLKLRRIHDIYGQIFINNYPVSTGNKKKEIFFEDKIAKNILPTEKKLVVSEITGSWIENIIFDNSIYWSIKDSQPLKMFPTKSSIPSDSRYREDLIWLKRSLINIEYNSLYENYSQKWKVALETQQRHDRNLRDAKKKK